MPTLGRVAFLGTSTRQGTGQILKEMEAAAEAFGLKLLYLDVKDPKDIEPAFLAAITDRVHAVLLLQSPVFNSHRAQIAALALKHRLPAIYPASQYVEDGGLIRRRSLRLFTFSWPTRACAAC